MQDTIKDYLIELGTTIIRPRLIIPLSGRDMASVLAGKVDGIGGIPA